MSVFVPQMAGTFGRLCLLLASMTVVAATLRSALLAQPLQPPPAALGGGR